MQDYADEIKESLQISVSEGDLSFFEWAKINELQMQELESLDVGAESASTGKQLSKWRLQEIFSEVIAQRYQTFSLASSPYQDKSKMVLRLKNSHCGKKLIFNGGGTIDDIISKYYVDKSEFLDRFFVDGPKCSMITRPRRFGKTTALSTIAKFFRLPLDQDVGHQPNLDMPQFQDWINNLKIKQSKSGILDYMNSVLVIEIDLLDLKDFKNYSQFLHAFQECIRKTYRKFKFLENWLQGTHRVFFEKIFASTASEVDFQSSISMLICFVSLFTLYSKIRCIHRILGLPVKK
jgi:hypothetical protein